MAVVFGSIPANLPVLTGKNYENWKIQIRVVMRFQGVWEFVEEGYIPVGERARDQQKDVDREKEKKDCKALFILHQSVDAANFEKIAMAQTSKEAWDILQKSHEGATKTKKIKLQTLRRQYELLQMEKNESVAEYITKVQTVVNSMKGYGEKITVQSVVEKVLRTMPPKFDHIVVAIEESKNLEELSLEELQGSLESHEQRMNERINEKKSEQALQARSNPNKHGDRWKKEKTEAKSNKWRGNVIRTTRKEGDPIPKTLQIERRSTKEVFNALTVKSLGILPMSVIANPITKENLKVMMQNWLKKKMMTLNRYC
ncbi:uncharacterized protein LOC114411336 [Glycine soja]|uniref:uncharacterized protein LOC114411336 n=1 Tax=Glycine soja TaxID=3848 RepID=UPI0010395BC0|nr:uncharacterized protein LOC114411336 [Glycine soja]